MPNIFIKERDYTSSGAPGSYANYSVLITGYVGTPSTEKGAQIVEADENGVYEFSSKQAFIDTIGEDIIVEKEVDSITEVHYGNRMARELLDLGYSIIYKPIDKIADMDDEKFWRIFNDKASYDFRFISHGMLNSNISDTDRKTYDEYAQLLAAFNNDAVKIAEIKKEVEASDDYKKAETDQRKIELLNDGYSNAIKVEGYAGFKAVTPNGFGEIYADFAAAEKALLGNTADNTRKSLEKRIKDMDEKCITLTVFNNINGHIAKLASYITTKDGTPTNAGRGDCVALIELDEREYVNVNATERPEELIIAGINNMPAAVTANGEYCAMTVPSVVYTINKEEVKLPGAFHYLACFMRSLTSGFAEWYAAAGYTRGVSNYTIKHTSVKLGEIAINALEPRNYKDGDTYPQFACNVIANFRGSYYLWGNRTAVAIPNENGDPNDLTAKSFLNIRQLCSTIKKQLYVACRRFTFDPNSDTLWVNFVNAIRPTLDAMRADQGVRDYKIMKVATDKKATLKAKIRIIPIEAVEDFDLEISLEDSFGETSAVVTE